MAAAMFCFSPATASALTAKEALGKKLFADTRLSRPQGQSCQSCHDPSAGFADPAAGSPTSRGAIDTLAGKRNSPTIGYAAFSPPLFLNTMMNGPTPGGVYEGGQNWDGSAPTLADQAKLPFLNPLEMNNTMSGVVDAVRTGTYAALFRQVYGAAAFATTMTAFGNVADAIAAYEASNEVNRFTSKYDEYLAGRAALDADEARGLALFEGKAACARCHPSRPSTMTPMPMPAPGTKPSPMPMPMPMPMAMRASATVMRPPMFTSRHHANVGVPPNAANPYYSLPQMFNVQGASWIDGGVGLVVNDAQHIGRFKIPTLRNVAETAPYGHNGVFPDLDRVVDFYNTRDVTSAAWPSPEWGQNIIKRDKLGNLGLAHTEIDDIVAFLGTLSDGWKPGLTLRTSSSVARRGTSVTLSGSVTPAAASVGRVVQVQVMKPGRRYWSYSSARAVYAGSGQATWWYRYGFVRGMAPGTYRFRAVYGAGGRVPYTSGAVAVAVR